jgi:hypothetical protein
VLGSGALALLGLAAANPDALIARYNLDHEHAVDLVYLAGLSDDAAPAFDDADLSRADRDCVLGREEEGEERALPAWNLGYQRALDLREATPEAAADCDWMGTYQSYEDVQNQVSGNAFFTTDRCFEFDTTAPAAMFAELGHRASVLNSDVALREASTVVDYSGATGTLYCGYSTETQGYLRLEVKRYADEAAAWDAMSQDQVDASLMGLEATGITDDHFTATGANGSGPEFRYSMAEEELYVSVFVLSPPDDAIAEEVARDFAKQVHERYLEFA